MGDWIEWECGDGMPVESGAMVDVRIEGGTEVLNKPASDYGWRERSIIRAYRLSTQEEAYAETDKPIGDSALSYQVAGSHYRHFAIQPITFINANEMDFLQGSVVKYISRHKMKGRRQDVEKAIHFCKMILELQYAEGK